MSRPTKFEDLSDYNQQGLMIAAFNQWAEQEDKPAIKWLDANKH